MKPNGSGSSAWTKTRLKNLTRRYSELDPPPAASVPVAELGRYVKKIKNLMGNLLGWLLKKENKKTCRFVGILLFLLYLVFFLGGGFNKEIDGHGIIFSSGWFREIFVVLLSILGLLGIILMLAGFSKQIK